MEGQHRTTVEIDAVDVAVSLTYVTAQVTKTFRSAQSTRPLVEEALGKRMLALLIQLDAACTVAGKLAEAVEEAFSQPDAEILLSFPGSASSAAPASSLRSGTTTPAPPIAAGA